MDDGDLVARVADGDLAARVADGDLPAAGRTSAWPTTWRLSHPRAVDGDSLRGHLAREEHIGSGFAALIFSASLQDDGSTVPATALLRLVIIDTPERGDPRWREARDEAAAWLAAHPDLSVDTYESAGMDRLLADVYPTGRRGDTLTQHLLRAGWDPWVPPERRSAPRGAPGGV